MSEALGIEVEGVTHPGHKRDHNEDCLLFLEELGLFGVFDGMGGHEAGEVASATARDTIAGRLRAVASAGGDVDRDAVLAAFHEAGAAVHAESKRRGGRRGMGTTAAVCKLLGSGADRRALIVHVGDSRVYLLRERRLRQLTVDHTIVAELLAKNAITPEEALRHPYRNVLSRNMGSKPAVTPDVNEFPLMPGDRLLLCSDGLTGFAPLSAIREIMAGADPTKKVSEDLVELALRGGGGDNVTCVIIRIGPDVVPRRTQIVRTVGAGAWLRRRERFLAEARARDVALSPVCVGLPPREAVDVVGGGLFDAVYHDLEESRGAHVWTFFDRLAAGWLEQGGDYAALRDLVDRLRAASDAVLADVAALDKDCASPLRGAVDRLMLVVEMAIASLLNRRLHQVEGRLAAFEAARHEAPFASESVTVPVAVARAEPPPPEVDDCLKQALSLATNRVNSLSSGYDTGMVFECLHRTHGAATDCAGQIDGACAARELAGTRALGEAAFAPLLDALDCARRIHVRAVRLTKSPAEVRAAALARVLTAHQTLCTSTAHLIVDATRPVRDKLRQTSERVIALRRQVHANEARITQLEPQRSTRIGWAARGAEEEP